MDFLERKRDRRMRDLAYRIAYFMEDYDPYGFRDALEVWETLDDGIRKAADYAYSEMRSGNYNQLIHDIYDDNMDGLPELKAEMDSIISDLKRLQSSSQKLISKNPLKLKRRKSRCN